MTILDPGTVTASVAPAEAEERGRLYFNVTLSQASENDVAVQWETGDDPEAAAAATADVDYQKGQRYGDRARGRDVRRDCRPIH